MFKIGIVGCGVVAEGHLEALSKSSDWELVALTESNPVRLQSVVERFQPQQSFSDYREMLAAVAMDAIVIATHVDSHHEITLAALQQGIHVLCEKPMADDIEKCREMCEAATRQERLLTVNFNTRSSEPYLTIKRIVDSGELGRIRVVRFVYDWAAHQWQPPERFQHFMDDGGPVIDSAVHFFEGVRWYTGQECERIDACGAIISPHRHPQHVIATCQLTDGTIALVEAGWLFTKCTKTTGMIYSVSVIGDDGTVDYNADNATIRLWTSTDTQEIACDDLDKHFERVHAAFAQSLRCGKLIGLASGHDGLKATEAAYRALHSAHSSHSPGNFG